MAWVIADHEHDAPAANELAVFTNALDAGANFHVRTLQPNPVANDPKRLSIRGWGSFVQGPSPRKIGIANRLSTTTIGANGCFRTTVDRIRAMAEPN